MGIVVLIISMYSFIFVLYKVAEHKAPWNIPILLFGKKLRISDGYDHETLEACITSTDNNRVQFNYTLYYFLLNIIM